MTALRTHGCRAALAVAAMPLALGCGAAAEPTRRSGDLVAQLVDEVSRAGALLSASRLLLLLLAVGGGFVTVRLFDAAIRMLWRFGLDSKRRLGAGRRLIDVLVFGALASWAVTRLAAAAPILTGLAAVFAVGGVIWALALPLQDLAAGLGIVLKGRIHEGDHIRVGATQGTVQEIGLLRLVLRDAVGATVYVPHRLIVQAVVQVHRDRRQIPATVRIPCNGAPPHEAMETARRIGLLSPWRIPGTPVSVTIDDDEAALLVELQTWTEAGVRYATRQLRGAVAAALGPASEPKRGDPGPIDPDRGELGRGELGRGEAFRPETSSFDFVSDAPIVGDPAVLSGAGEDDGSSDSHKPRRPRS